MREAAEPPNFQISQFRNSKKREVMPQLRNTLDVCVCVILLKGPPLCVSFLTPKSANTQTESLEAELQQAWVQQAQLQQQQLRCNKIPRVLGVNSTSSKSCWGRLSFWVDFCPVRFPAGPLFMGFSFMVQGMRVVVVFRRCSRKPAGVSPSFLRM